MGFALTFLSIFFDEYNIPSEPIKFIFELLLVIIFSIPKVIGATISYVYFPPEPKNVEGKLILVRKYYKYLTLLCIIYTNYYYYKNTYLYILTNTT